MVAVQRGQAGGTCFCVSMNTWTGGRVRGRSGADRGPRRQPSLLHGADRLRSWRGGARRGAAPAGGGHERVAAGAVHARTASQMGRELYPPGSRSCCTATSSTPAGTRSPSAASPAELHDGVPDLFLHDGRGRHRPGRRARRAPPEVGSCFTVDYSHIHGGAVRVSPRSRYRQWMTHKLASWWDQFDSSGCVAAAVHHMVPGGDRPHRGSPGDPRERGAVRCRRLRS